MKAELWEPSKLPRHSWRLSFNQMTETNRQWWMTLIELGDRAALSANWDR